MYVGERYTEDTVPQQYLLILLEGVVSQADHIFQHHFAGNHHLIAQISIFTQFATVIQPKPHSTVLRYNMNAVFVLSIFNYLSIDSEHLWLTVSAMYTSPAKMRSPYKMDTIFMFGTSNNPFLHLQWNFLLEFFGMPKSQC